VPSLALFAIATGSRDQAKKKSASARSSSYVAKCYCKASIAFGIGCEMGIGWVRRHRRHGSLLALAALVLQIALSFTADHPHGCDKESYA
jgi:hypothetical protein